MAWLELLLHAGVDPTVSGMAQRYQHWLGENLRLHEILRRESGRQVLVDSSKGFRFGTGFYKLRPANTRIILLTRDGRGVVSSHLRSGMRLESSARNWATYYARATEWIDRCVVPSHVLRVYYENVVSNPELEMNRIYEFLELPKSNDSVKLKQGDGHILDGNRGVLKDSAEIKSDERWRRDLSASDIKYFERVGGAMMSKLGYSMQNEAR